MTWSMLVPMSAIGDFFNTIMSPIYWVISGLLVGYHHITSPLFGFDSGWSWTAAIILMTITIRLLVMPLYAKQLNAARAMQAIQPKINELRTKYGNDRERLGQETMRLYEAEGVNPTASCLPMLIQMPVLLSLFQVLNGAAVGTPKGYWLTRNDTLVESLRQAEVGGIRLADRFWPFDTFGGTQVLALILIILMTAFLLIQQLTMMRRNMAPAMLEGPLGQQQKMMVWVFPVVYAVTGVNIPIGVLIYWVFSNLWMLGQQSYIIHTFPTPGTPAYVDWEERMRAKGLDPRTIERERVAKGQSKRMKERHEARVAAEAAAAENIRANQERTVARQQGATRATVRKNADGTKQVVQRQQPRQQTRAARKKK